jgi:hypothetical protein
MNIVEAINFLRPRFETETGGKVSMPILSNNAAMTVASISFWKKSALLDFESILQVAFV